MAAGGYSRNRLALPVACRSRYLRRAPCDHSVFVSNAFHDGLNQRFLSITPKPFDAVDMIFGLFTYKVFGVTHRHMFSVSLQRLISAKRIGVIDRSLAGMRLDMIHQSLT